MRRGIILFDHGSRDAERNQLVIEAARSLGALFPESTVAHAYLELVEPPLLHAIESLVENGCCEIIVQPFFLGAGAHVKKDLTQIVENATARYPSTQISVTRPLGPDPKLIEIAQERIFEVLKEKSAK